MGLTAQDGRVTQNLTVSYARVGAVLRQSRIDFLTKGWGQKILSSLKYEINLFIIIGAVALADLHTIVKQLQDHCKDVYVLRRIRLAQVAMKMKFDTLKAGVMEHSVTPALFMGILRRLVLAVEANLGG